MGMRLAKIVCEWHAEYLVHSIEIQIEYSRLNRITYAIHAHLHSGSSGSVQYSLSPGTYTLRVVARAANGEKEIERRRFHIGTYIFYVHMVSYTHPKLDCNLLHDPHLRGAV